jgi:predicted phosphoribosyltransferase
VARKLGAPGYSELAIGAVTSNGGQFLNAEIIRELHVSPEYLRHVTSEQMAEARRREERFRGGRGAARIQDRVVIVVDDGLATGATMRASVRSVRRQGAKKIVVAVPVGSVQACDALRDEADELLCLLMPDDFWAVGYYYLNFEPVEDDVVERILREAHESEAAPRAPAAS